VLRFAQRLGFDGFTALQIRLREELSGRTGGPLARFGRLPAHGSVAELVRATTAGLADSACRSIAEIPAHELEAAVGLLADASRRVFVVGGRISRVVAEHLVQQLQTVRPLVTLLDDPWRRDLGTLLDSGRGDVFVIVDIRRYQRELVELAAHLHGRGAAVVVLTDEWLSPAAQHADVVLSVSVASSSPFESMVSGVMLVEALVVAAMPRLGAVAHERRRAWEELSRTEVMDR
jgi:DNA-binding MurR/RpiR family transcriptional regulator